MTLRKTAVSNHDPANGVGGTGAGLKKGEFDDEPVVVTRGLRKGFGRQIVGLDCLNLSIYRGETYGLLGPNGAGKSTLISLLAGLARADSGHVRVLGGDPRSRQVLARVGWLGDGAFYPFLSGRANLVSIARRGGVSKQRVEKLLERVGLLARADDAVKGYSLGMRQRLRLAVALLKEPELLILDEPSNGLDPVGQLEVRELIRSLAHEGRTVVISSHDVEDVEALCTRIGIMSGGRLIMEGTSVELRGEPSLYVHALPQHLAVSVASRQPGVTDVATENSVMRIGLLEPGDKTVHRIINELSAAGVSISGFELRQRLLRDVFLDATDRHTGGEDSLRLPR